MKNLNFQFNYFTIIQDSKTIKNDQISPIKTDINSYHFIQPIYNGIPGIELIFSRFTAKLKV